ncbi:phosphomethylpyrimidine kinase [Neokomagataea thailandica NBRC 106555]|uniref:hydroxymethylpyrimidine kinase n=2 Tax=Neokomagataea TaxID=1223423 RepID=A0A4Y6V740_9PROT|nr:MULTISPECIES: bifunctional hydroxymethylpyrimidine kinase/phosphomethylpyrimidine kinase [Neokomagataea]QDH24307.1 bifunctional hydroxymethylpyrimidine kinase/phosphomethylpyrimidine kinase [Neokomagataea tanensis]GBR53092.1 phosphomethylpyrimidine kinase [Neokomagataea thailandica NBRC 106555]
MRGRVLTIAGSDSGGGAGIQADLKAVTALGGFGMSAITALTAQNTCGVYGVHPVPVAFVKQQIAVVMQDLGADCIKIGMLGQADTVHAVADALEAYPDVPIVLDPVMIATSGAALMETDGIHVVRERLLARCRVVTPNIPEAEALTGIKIDDFAAMQKAARQLLADGAGAVLLKGGHLPAAAGPYLYDLLMSSEGDEHVFKHKRLETRNTHGTGCTLASALATGLAQGLALEASVRRAVTYLQEALLTAPGFGQGHGPVNHGVSIQPRWNIAEH